MSKDGKLTSMVNVATDRNSTFPSLCFSAGWVMKVRSSHLAKNLRNLLSGGLARSWLEDARRGLIYSSWLYRVRCFKMVASRWPTSPAICRRKSGSVSLVSFC